VRRRRPWPSTPEKLFQLLLLLLLLPKKENSSALIIAAAPGARCATMDE